MTDTFPEYDEDGVTLYDSEESRALARAAWLQMHDAAPDMLAALRALVAMVPAVPHEAPEWGFARAAIAKAGG